MKITHISRVVTIALFLVMVFFIVSIGWSLSHLSDAFQSVEKYGQLKAKVTNRVQIPINTYLDTGDAVLLNEIEASIQSLIDHEGQDETLSPRVRKDLYDLLTSIEGAVAVDLRGAGKMADPQVLLVNNENQLADEVATLRGYVDRTNKLDETTKRSYFKVLSEMQFNLLRLASSRQNYFAAPSAAALRTVETYLRNLADLSSRLSGYPSLEVHEERRSDEMADLLGWNDDSKENHDVSKEHISELASLVGRYPRELENAKKLIDQKTGSRIRMNEQMLDLQQRLEQLGQIISADYQDTEWALYVLVFICLSLIIGISVSMVLLLRHIAIIINLTSGYLNKLATGDLRSSFALSGKIAEVVQLNNAVAQLKEYFEHLIGNIHQETSVLNQCRQAVIEGSRQMEISVEEQQEATVVAAEQMNQLSLSFQDVARNAGETRNVAISARDCIGGGVDKMRNTRSQVNELTNAMDETESSLQQLQKDVKAIEGVLCLIQGFTEQTNLLALNAAIEAARAGEHGRGFAVVADEVRKLASHTAKSAGEIQLLVEKLNNATSKTVGFMQQQRESANQTVQSVELVNQAFAAIHDAINDIHEQNALIAAAAEQQSAVAEQVALGIRNTAEAAEASSVEAQKNKVRASELDQISDNLQALVSQFLIH